MTPIKLSGNLALPMVVIIKKKKKTTKKWALIRRRYGTLKQVIDNNMILFKNKGFFCDCKTYFLK